MEIRNPQILSGKYSKDFSDGFYCTALKEQAARWASRYETPVISEYEYEKNAAMQAREFQSMTEEWLDFIVFCRSGRKHDYDIVEGPMANDQVYNYISDYISGAITREQFWVLAKFKRPTHQIAFCSSRALERIVFLQSEAAK